jgi:hypothetical protein
MKSSLKKMAPVLIRAAADDYCDEKVFGLDDVTITIFCDFHPFSAKKMTFFFETNVVTQNW